MAAWKPKEKPLTVEEAVALAKRELSKFWLGSEPLLATVRTGNKVSAHPLDPSFSQRAWLMVFLDPTGFSGESALAYAEEWHRRFSSHELGVIVVHRVPYPSLRAIESLELLLPKRQFPFIMVLDPNGDLSSAFGIADSKELPKAIVLEGAKPIYQRGGREWCMGAELQIQAFLRRKDPGLPLPPVFDRKERDLTDVEGIEFGDASLYPKPGFGPAEDGRLVGRFAGENSLRPEAGRPTFALSGTWIKDGERIITEDPNASLALEAQGSHVAFVAQLAKREPGAAEIVVELEGARLYDAIIGPDLTQDENGSSVIKVRDCRVYRALANLPASSRQITLRFPNAKELPVALYGGRYGK